ncbi:hypothetical protein ROZALSC1DRAFT_24589, partial [Rozella allomycis CSF55]
MSSRFNFKNTSSRKTLADQMHANRFEMQEKFMEEYQKIIDEILCLEKAAIEVTNEITMLNETWCDMEEEAKEWMETTEIKLKERKIKEDQLKDVMEWSNQLSFDASHQESMEKFDVNTLTVFKLIMDKQESKNFDTIKQVLQGYQDKIIELAYNWLAGEIYKICRSLNPSVPALVKDAFEILKSREILLRSSLDSYNKFRSENIPVEFINKIEEKRILPDQQFINEILALLNQSVIREKDVLLEMIGDESLIETYLSEI